MEICESCQLKITGPSVHFQGKVWHLECCLCKYCGKFIQANDLFLHDKDLVHLKCLAASKRTFCPICGEPFKTNIWVDYWGNMYCSKHNRQFSQCFSCGRLISAQITGGGIDYLDGRKVCNICRKTIVTSPEKAKATLERVKDFFASIDMNLSGITASIRFVDLSELARESRDLHNIATGLTKATKIGSSSRPIGKVNELLILIGLPEIHTAYIFSHELCHVWLLIARFPELDPLIEEGVCELVSYLWLKYVNTPETRFWMKRIADNKNPIYGGGFQHARQGFNLLGGLPELLAYLRQYRAFPA